jgi:hypothetical protein
MSQNHKITAVAVILTALASPSLASSQKSSSHHHSVYGARGGAITGDVNPDRVFPNEESVRSSTPNGYWRSTRQKHSHKRSV